jgi:hypothetical protein
MIPLASDLLPFPGQMRREDHGEVRQPAKPTFFIWPLHEFSAPFLRNVQRH